MKKHILFLLVPFLFCPFFNLRAEVINDLSFIPENVWYSGGELKDGEVVNIHTAIWNGLDDKVVMKIDFYDKDTLLGARDLSIEPKDLSEVSISWRVTAGEHYISAKIISPKSVVDGIEKDIIPSLKVKFYTIKCGKLRRYLSFKTFLSAPYL